MEPIQIDALGTLAASGAHAQEHQHGNAHRHTHQVQHQHGHVVVFPPVQTQIGLGVGVPLHGQGGVHPQYQVQSHGTLGPALLCIGGPAPGIQVVMIAEDVGPDDVLHRWGIGKHPELGGDAQHVALTFPV